MADAAHDKIDQLYDFAERAVEGIGRVLGVDVTAPAAVAKGQIVDRRAARTLPVAAQRALPAPTSAPVAPWQIVEAIDADTKAITFTVTNGAESADCKSRDFAEQVLAAMTSTAPMQLAANGRGRRR